MKSWMEVEEAVAALERAALRAALVEGAWTLAGAARALRMPRSSLQRVLGRHPGLAAEIPRHRAAVDAVAHRASAYDASQ
jgi:transcriptional regulator with GAF, ATPase, and Fis domain